jgi:hypothetical protein
MSKKTRRQRRPNLPPEAFNTPVAASAASSTRGVTVAPAAAPAAMARKGVAINWQQEYGEVMGDLKRTGILFFVLMAAMGVLSFIIR